MVGVLAGNCLLIWHLMWTLFSCLVISGQIYIQTSFLHVLRLFSVPTQCFYMQNFIWINLDYMDVNLFYLLPWLFLTCGLNFSRLECTSILFISVLIYVIILQIFGGSLFRRLLIYIAKYFACVLWNFGQNLCMFGWVCAKLKWEWGVRLLRFL